MPKKEGKKGKKDEVVIETTNRTLRERARCMCPMLGNSYHRTEVVEDIRMDMVMFKIQRSMDKNQAAIDLSSSSLYHVPPDLRTLPNLNQITDLNLANNHLFNGEQLFDVLAALPDLRRLDLSSNMLNGVLSEKCANLVNIVEIKLDRNELTGLPPQVGSWERVQYFSASNNAITAVPTEVGKWVEVQYVNLRCNQLKELPDTICSWTKTRTLLLGTNFLSRIPPQVEVMPELVELDVRKNAVSEIPRQLAQCTNLVKLHVGENKLTVVPGEVLGVLKKLGELHLYKNKLTELPQEVGQLAELYRLTLSSNNFRSLPEDIGQCANLRELYINNCPKFSGFPPAAGHLRKLQELQCKKCPAFKNMPGSVLEWDSLKELDVRAAKKQVCKLPAELVQWLTEHKCNVRGGVPQKPKGAKGGKKK